jgi:predicted alpha/beta-hydrolase family hydrolase
MSSLKTVSDTQKLTIQVNETESVTGLVYPAAKQNRARVTVILGHGAGADQMSGFMRMVAAGLAERGLDAMTFNFLYKEQGRGVPDPKARLESTYRAVIEAALNQRKLKDNKLVIGGKSMGGRIASQVAAEHPENIDGLVFLGYPLHPPGRPDKMRDQHLPEIKAPLLFCQGSRDTFGTEDEIKAIIKKHKLRATLYVIESGDHSFKVPKSVKPQQQVYEDVMDEVVKWCADL